MAEALQSPSLQSLPVPAPLVFSPVRPIVSQRMSEPVPESKPETMPEPAEDPWRVAFVEFKTRDEKMVKDYQEEIDTLLVFAGLFSAVLTAFVVESYQSLQEDLAQTSVDLLRQISHQLANSSFPAAADSSQFQPQRSDVRVNVCWFVSLLLSLVVALFGIFLKQWMRAYMKWTDVTPDREAVALRQLRYRSLESWRLGAILTLLPTLLQLSVILFLSGLLVFLWSLDRMVADVMAVLLIITFFLVATATVLPVVSWSCPYRSPLSEVLTLSLWRVTSYAKFFGRVVRFINRAGWASALNRSLWVVVFDRWRDLSKSTLPTSWVQADEGAIARYNSNEDHVSMHVSAMVHLCRTTQSQPLWSAALAAIVAESPTDNLSLTYAIGEAYCNEVWWPVLGHISLFTENDLKLEAGRLGWSMLPMSTSSAFTRLSSSMKHCWVNFLLHSKSLVCQSDSTGVAESYMICCLAGIESTTGGPCMRAFMEVLEAQRANLQALQLSSVARCLDASPKAALLHSLLDIKFVDSVKVICNGLSAMHTITPEHRLLLDILVQLACHVAMATTKDPHERVPEDLKDLMRALQNVDASDPLYMSYWNADSCAPALIFVARHEPDLFPKPFARTIVRKLEPLQVWNVACDVDGLDVEGIDVTRINVHWYFWTCLEARTPNAMELLIAPLPFGRILDAYEEQVK